MLRTEDGQGLFLSLHTSYRRTVSLFWHTDCCTARADFWYLVRTRPGPHPRVRVSRDHRQVQLGKHGDAWVAHESKCPNLHGLPNESLEGAGRRLPAMGVVGWVWRRPRQLSEADGVFEVGSVTDDGTNVSGQPRQRFARQPWRLNLGTVDEEYLLTGHTYSICYVQAQYRHAVLQSLSLSLCQSVSRCW